MFNNQQLVQESEKLKKFALRLTRNEQDADDLLQSTLLRAIEKKHLFQDDTDLFKWTSKMMYNLFVSGYRRKTKFETQYDPDNYLEGQSINAPQEKQVELSKVTAAMSMLTEEHREVLVLVCVQGMRYQDVAETLDVPVGTVRSRLSRAREQLQTLLDAPTGKQTFTFSPPANRVTLPESLAA